MSKKVAPRPATELFPESLNLSPKQRQVLDTLGTFSHGAKVGDVAKALGMHINTARGHLDELVDRDAVVAVPTAATGRGRPSLIYSVRIPDNRAVAREYLTLIEVLAAQLADQDSAEAKETALAVGRMWGTRMKQEGYSARDMQSAVTNLFQHLRQMGFDPTVDQATEEAGEVNVTMHSCPFVLANHKPSMFLCMIHQGMLNEFVGDDSVNLKLKPFDAPGCCTIAVTGVAAADAVPAAT